MALVFNVIDSPMGVGKTTAIMTMVKNSTEYYNIESHKRFIFISPYINEVEQRISKEIQCKYPHKGKKLEQVKDFITNGENIACCHALFNIFDKETFDLIRNCGYSYDLIVDEQPSLVRNIVGSTNVFADSDDKLSRIEIFSQNDIRLLQENKAIMLDVDTQLVKWNNDHWYNVGLEQGKAVFSSFKFYAETTDMYSIKKKDNDQNRISTIVAFTKKEIFELFNDVWISSYMTKDSMLDYYCQMNNIKISYYHISNYAIVEGYRFDYPKEFERLCICQNEKYNLNFALSKAWYKREKDKVKIITNKEPACLKSLASAFRNFLKYVCQNENPNSYYWTTFKASQSDIPKKYISQKRFLECNKKATNEYDQCTAVGYLCNRFINPNIINVFADKGIQFDNDQYALSELLQFVYRSNLRVEDSDKIVNVFIPAKRMRMLLWNFQQKYMTLRNNISA